MEMLNVPHDIAIEKDISEQYPSKTGKILYKRDRNGLRGPFTDYSKVNLLTLGGSTTDLSDISEGDTWQDILAEEFKKESKEVQIVNAGIDGQTVLGHSTSIRIWLRHIPGLKPKYVLAYIGINDVCAEDKSYALFLGDENSLESLMAHRSALYYLYRTFRGMIVYAKSYMKIGKFVYPQTSSEDTFRLTDKPVLQNHDELFSDSLNAYERRFRRLLRRIREFNAVPIFVTQKLYNPGDKEGRVLGFAEESDCWGHKVNGVDIHKALDLVNERTLRVCEKENLLCLDLAKELQFEPEDFSDLQHNTPSGTVKIGRYLHGKLKNLF